MHIGLSVNDDLYEAIKFSLKSNRDYFCDLDVL